MSKSKIAQILEVVSGSMIFPCPLGEYHVARAIRDANRCGSNLARLNAAKRAAKKCRLIVAMGDAGFGEIIVRNNESGLIYRMLP